MRYVPLPPGLVYFFFNVLLTKEAKHNRLAYLP